MTLDRDPIQLTFDDELSQRQKSSHPLQENASDTSQPSLAGVIDEIASDAAHDMLFDLLPDLSKYIPDNLPSGVWDSLCKDFMGDMTKLIKARLQWFTQSIQAEASEIKQRQIQEAIEQCRWETLQETQRLNPQPAPAPELEIKVIFSHRDSAQHESVGTPLVIPTGQPVRGITSQNAEHPKPIEKPKVHTGKANPPQKSARTNQTYPTTEPSTPSNDFFSQEDDIPKPQRLRRRSGRSSVAI